MSGLRVPEEVSLAFLEHQTLTRAEFMDGGTIRPVKRG